MPESALSDATVENESLLSESWAIKTKYIVPTSYARCRLSGIPIKRAHESLVSEHIDLW